MGMKTMSCKVPPEHAELVRAAGGGALLRELVARWVAAEQESRAIAAYQGQPDNEAVTASTWPADLDDDDEMWQRLYEEDEADIGADAP